MLALVSHFTGMIDPHIVINTIALISSACWFLKLSAMAHSALEGRKLYPSKKKKKKPSKNMNFCPSTVKSFLSYAPKSKTHISCNHDAQNQNLYSKLIYLGLDKNITRAGQAPQPLSRRAKCIDPYWSSLLLSADRACSLKPCPPL